MLMQKRKGNMKNRLLTMDPELAKKIEGLSRTQIIVMADVFLGISRELAKTAKQRKIEKDAAEKARN